MLTPTKISYLTLLSFAAGHNASVEEEKSEYGVGIQFCNNFLFTFFTESRQSTSKICRSTLFFDLVCDPFKQADSLARAETCDFSVYISHTQTLQRPFVDKVKF